ncbi:hypothetical protein SAMN04515674_11511 [Pseudarcicella hirudinis]|uniref:DUF3471 domain-containing protein n=1 Tax=Pseudarcicella hirudinis TaxID=1079859 RepID=A0A1I5XJG3_9BACT|nr:hypothetical protein [Pseudarcicella hirudinis]SFQ32068.1 hypothetical protein SAMN04515674_11511 [Pseudarcicella hirudinis]
MKKNVFLFIFLLLSVCLAKANSGVSPSVKIAADSLAFKDYYGSFKMAANPYVEKVKISFKDGQLTIQSKEYPQEAPLTREKEGDEFLLTAFEAKVIFLRKNGSDVTGLKILVQGQELEGEKEM